MGTTAKVRKQLRARRIEAEWETEPDRFVVLSCSHFPSSKAMIATLRRERADRSVGGIESRIFAPFQDMERVAVTRVPRYSAKALEAFFAVQLERVEAERAGAGKVGEMFRQPTTA